MALKIKTIYYYYYYVMLPIIGIVLVLFYTWYTPSLLITENKVLFVDPTTLIKLKNISLTLTTICNPIYFILTTYHFENTFFQNGFSKQIKQCKSINLNELGITTKPVKRRDYPQCYIYNESFEINNPLCAGGKLIWKHRPLAKPLQLRIESKFSLYKILTQYCNKHYNYTVDNFCSFYLLSYNMDIDSERNIFLNKHIDCNINKPQYNKTWVFKENTHTGVGIHIYNNHKLIYQLLISSKNESEQIKKKCGFKPLKNESWFKEERFKYYKINGTDYEGYVVNKTELLMQEFVSNPMLIDTHIFHIRSHFLIASYQDPFIVLHWPRPNILINPNDYNNKEIKLNKKKILTNRFIVLGDDYEKGPNGYKYTWGYTQFQEYFDRKYGNDLFGGNYTRNKMNNDLRNIVKYVFIADEYDRKLNGIYDPPKYKMNYNQMYFDEYCMDVIMTHKFELKLMEFNTFCGLDCDKKELKIKKKNGGYDWECDTKKVEATQIIWEIFKKKMNNQTIEKIEALNTYEIAYWKK
eukprot:169320_1